MADENIDDEDLEDVSLPDNGMKKKILLYLIPAIVIIGLAVGGIVVLFTKVNSDAPQNYDVITQKDADGKGEHSTVFYTLPEIRAQLSTSNGVFETVRIKINLELSAVEDIASIDIMMPRINDIIIAHLVELTPDEISGSEGFYALKTELLYRINLMVSPVKVLNLNIKDLNVKITDTLEKTED